MLNTSGEKNKVYMSVNDIISSAVRKCGVTEGAITPTTIRMAKQNLLWTLQELSTRGTPIWGIETVAFGLNQQQQIYTLPSYVYDLIYVNWRQTTMLSYTTTGGVDPEFLIDYNYYSYATTTDHFTAELGSEPGQVQLVGTMGIFFFGNQLNTITMETSIDGITWTTVYQETMPTQHNDGTWIWQDLNPQLYATYARVSCAAGQMLSLRAFYIADLTSATELPLNRMNRDTYGAYVNKNSLGQPLLYYYEKQINPLLYVWNEPQNCFDWQLTMKRKTVVDDPGLLTQELDVPSWYQEGVTWQLAARLHLELPRDQVDPSRYPIIAQTAEEKINLAMNAETDGNPISIAMDFSCYTR